jgi:hypothetical protein
LWNRFLSITRLSLCQCCPSSLTTRTRFLAMKWMTLHNLFLLSVGVASHLRWLLQILLGISKSWRWFDLVYAPDNMILA